jgi:glycosyltransferase involved in cell wall biosynthesis
MLKRIGIDARLYFQTGVGVYLRNFLHYLEQQLPKDYEFFVYVLRRDSSKIHFNSPKFIKREVTSQWHSIAEQTQFLSVLNNDNLDLMHFTYFSYPVFYRKKYIATIHDITPLTHKTGRASTLNPMLYELKYQSYKFVLSQQIRNATIIITPTETVKNQILEKYGQSFTKKIVPIYEGVNYEMQNAKPNTELKNKYNNPFFVYIGNFYPHKNVEALVTVFKEMPKHVDLILVGPNSYFSGRVKNEMANQKITNIRFHHTGSNEDLIFFYKNAIALVNPSLSEGFGLPLVEAAYFNTPIIASNLEVFHEILGNSFISFYPKSPADIHQKLKSALENPSTLPKAQLSSSFSFEKMTKDILKLYQQLI